MKNLDEYDKSLQETKKSNLLAPSVIIIICQLVIAFILFFFYSHNTEATSEKMPYEGNLASSKTDIPKEQTPSTASPNLDDLDISELKKKAEQGDSSAQLNIGGRYCDGKGVEKNFKEAANWYRKAAEQGNIDAQRILGVCYFKGEGVEKDLKEAVNWYRKAAEQGNAGAQYNLGLCYGRGTGVPKDATEAFKWWTKAGNLGDADAQFWLGLCYDSGEGVEKDLKEAANWFRKAAEQGNSDAQHNIGLCYLKGEGVEQDLKEAVNWFRKAAEQGNSGAQLSLGLSYDLGQGVEKDLKEAVKWYRRAACQGNPSAQKQFGICYFFGQGVIEDNIEAYKWLLIAGANGEDVEEAKDIMTKEMTQAQIAEARQKAKEFVEEKELNDNSEANKQIPSPKNPKSTGTGFFVDKNGYLITAYHVIQGSKLIKINTSIGLVDASVVFGDVATDIAILKIEGSNFSILPLVSSSSVKTGDKIFTMGYPNIRMQGQEPKYTDGTISSLSGSSNNLRYFQISIPVQPGNSGGPLVNEQGCVVGVVTARLSDAIAISETGSIPQNVNYAVKSAFVLPFLENIPELKITSTPIATKRDEII